MNLTEAEQKELKENPPGTTPKTPEQFQLRLEIAKKMCTFFNENDPTMSDEVRDVYTKYPMWGFYVNEDGLCPRRSYGVCFYPPSDTTDESAKIPALHMVTAHIFFINDVVGGVEASTVRRIDAWSESNLNLINLCSSPGIFLDPLGFWLPLSQNAS